jgi:hypothetical protein
MDESLFSEWQNRIDRIFKEFEKDVIYNHQMYMRYKEAVKGMSFSADEWGFNHWLEYNHYVTLLAGIRKTILGDRDAISLRKLIEQIKRFEPRLTRTRYLALLGGKGGLLEEAALDAAAEGFFNGDDLDVGRLESDLNTIAAAKATLGFINERVLHMDKVQNAPVPTDEELEELILKLGELLSNYNLFLKGVNQMYIYDNGKWVTIFKAFNS